MGFTKKQIKAMNHEFKAECLTEIGYQLNLSLEQICFLTPDKQDELIHIHFNLTEKESQAINLILLLKQSGSSTPEIFQQIDKISNSDKEVERFFKKLNTLGEVLKVNTSI
jgi:hypothetical protein